MFSRTDLDLSSKRYFERWEPSCRQRISGFTFGGPRIRYERRKTPKKETLRGGRK